MQTLAYLKVSVRGKEQCDLEGTEAQKRIIVTVDHCSATATVNGVDTEEVANDCKGRLSWSGGVAISSFGPRTLTSIVRSRSVMASSLSARAASQPPSLTGL